MRVLRALGRAYLETERPNQALEVLEPLRQSGSWRILHALGLKPHDLDAVRLEHTRKLPATDDDCEATEDPDDG